MTSRFLIAIIACQAVLFSGNSSKWRGLTYQYNYSMPAKMKITIGKQPFTAVLSDNAASKKLISMLPLTLSMIELNGNEKYGDLGLELPVNSTKPGKIATGDIMLYGSSTLVLFYKSFPTPYSYTPLGRVENVNGLEEALGRKNVSVVFESE